MNIRWLIIVIRVRCGHPRNRAWHGHVVEVTVVQAFRALEISVLALIAFLRVFLRLLMPGPSSFSGERKEDSPRAAARSSSGVLFL